MATTTNTLTSSVKNLAAISSTLLQEVINIINEAARPHDEVFEVEIPRINLTEVSDVEFATSVDDAAQPLFNMAFGQAMLKVAEDTVVSFNEIVSRMSEEQSRFAKAANKASQPAAKDILIAVSRGFRFLAVTKKGNKIAYRTAKTVQSNFLAK